MNSNTPHTDLFKRFIKEIQLWYRTGKEPKSGSQDMKYALQLQEKQMKSHHLRAEMRFEPESEVSSSAQVLNAVPVLNAFAKFLQDTCFQSGTQTITYYRDEQQIFRREKHVTIYENILEPEPGDRQSGGTPYSCPNCGAVSTLSILQEKGCPYCSTRYFMKDLYPRVSNFYSLDSASLSDKQAKRHKGVIAIGAVVISLIATVYGCFAGTVDSLLIGIASFLGGLLIGAFAMYLGMAMIYLVYSFVQAGKSISVVKGSVGAKKKLSKLDPSFSYEYFEGKALSLTRMILFHDDLENCPQYRGNGSFDEFSDLIDIQYRGGFGVESIRKNQDRIEAVLKLFLTNTYDNGRKLTEKDEKIRIRMYHRGNLPVNPTFSIRAVQCPNCGGSFDARETKVCPFCSEQYDAGLSDWVVTEIQK